MVTITEPPWLVIDRFVSCVGAVGVVDNEARLAAKLRIQPGDIIICTDNGAGGGTITVTAIFSDTPDVIPETLNINFFQANRALFDHGLFQKIHAVTDWTNGGIRLDFNTICADPRDCCSLKLQAITCRHSTDDFQLGFIPNLLTLENYWDNS